jgi:hypothetical protein
MKTAKSIFLLLSFLVLFSTISFSQACDCVAPPNLVPVHNSAIVTLPSGVNVHWQIFINTFNEGIGSSSYASASVTLRYTNLTPIESHFYSHTNTALYTEYRQTYTGITTWTTGSNQQAYLVCDAYRGPDNGGGAHSNVRVWW